MCVCVCMYVSECWNMIYDISAGSVKGLLCLLGVAARPLLHLALSHIYGHISEHIKSVRKFPQNRKNSCLPELPRSSSSGEAAAVAAVEDASPAIRGSTLNARCNAANCGMQPAADSRCLCKYATTLAKYNGATVATWLPSAVQTRPLMLSTPSLSSRNCQSACGCSQTDLAIVSIYCIYTAYILSVLLINL